MEINLRSYPSFLKHNKHGLAPFYISELTASYFAPRPLESFGLKQTFTDSLPTLRKKLITIRTVESVPLVTKLLKSTF